MSEIISNVLNGASTYDKVRIQQEYNEKVFKRDMHALFIASARAS